MVSTPRFLKGGVVRYPPSGIGYDIAKNVTRPWCTLAIPPFVFAIIFCFGTLSWSCDLFMWLQCIFHLTGMRCKKYTVPSYLFNQFNPKSEQNYYERFTFFLLSDARRGNLSAVIPLVSLRRGSVVNMLNHFSKYVKALQFDVYQNFD